MERVYILENKRGTERVSFENELFQLMATIVLCPMLFSVWYIRLHALDQLQYGNVQ